MTWVLMLLLACAIDADADGWPRPDDCDDADADVSPDAAEVCDGLDNDCDGDADEPQALDADAWWVDADGDGFGDPDRLAKACEHPPGWVANDADCDDDDEAVNPDAAELPGNGTDDDCDPSTSE